MKLVIDERESYEKIILHSSNKTRIIECFLVDEFGVEEYYDYFLKKNLIS